MTARLTDPKCRSLECRKTIFDNPFTKLKYILCSPFLSLVGLEITLASHTPNWGASARNIEKTSTIESAQKILGGIKENSQSLKLPTQS